MLLNNIDLERSFFKVDSRFSVFRFLFSAWQVDFDRFWFEDLFEPGKKWKERKKRKENQNYDCVWKNLMDWLMDQLINYLIK